jgi:hypothetical protein
VFYVLRPSVYPDQPWAMRRYLPVVIPGVVIAIAVTLTAAWTAAQHRRGALERALAFAGVVALGGLVALPTARAELPLVRARDQQGALAAVRTVCVAVPSDGAILLTGASLFPKDLALEWSQALRAFCGVPTAIPRTYDPPDLPELASQWRAAGRRLFVVSTNPKDDLRRTPGARLAAHVTVPDAYAPVSVFDRRPTRRGPRLRRDISLLTIPAAAR